MKINKFYFSVSTNAFQIEGGRSLHGRTDSIWDWFTKTYYQIPPVNSVAREINSIEVASDFYHKYKTDAKILKKLGVDAFIYNLDWARVFPKNQDQINPAGIQFYDDVFAQLHERNIKPIPILFHWDTPMWAELKGGWASRDILPAFRNYCAAMFKYLGKYTDIWFVNDENKSFTIDGYLTGLFPPCHKNEHAFVNAVHNLVLSGAIAKEEFLKAKALGYVSPQAILGIDDDWSPPVLEFVNHKEGEKLLQNYNAWMRDLWLDPNLLGHYPQEFMDYIRENQLEITITAEDLKYIKKFKLDFIGWNFYRPAFISPKSLEINKNLVHKPPGAFPFGDVQIVLPKSHPNYTKWMWPIAPQYMQTGLEQLKAKYDLPVFIVESGLGDFDDKSQPLICDYDRINYLHGMVEQVELCRHQDLNLMGYSVWTYCDIFSPSAGYRKDYGLVSVDFNSPIRERKPKLSYVWYQQVIESRGQDIFVDKHKLEQKLERLLETWDIFLK